MKIPPNKIIVSELAREYGYLPYMIDRYIKILGIEETKEFLKANENTLMKSIRINTIKIKIESLLLRLEKKGVKLQQIDQIPYGFKILKSKYNLGSTHEFLQGYYYLQNEASMIPALVLSPKSSEVIIDMCAAPGSKSTQLAQEMNNKGALILIERNSKRIPKLEYNLRRMGVENSIVINMDARKLDSLNIRANKILLDAPCSGEGLIRVDPNRKRSKTKLDIERLTKIQKELLKAGLKTLKPGGQLMYCTCSIAPEENELVVNSVLNELQDFSIVEMNRNFGVNGLTNAFGFNLIDDLKFSQRLYPHIKDTIGFYLCLIEKVN